MGLNIFEVLIINIRYNSKILIKYIILEYGDRYPLKSNEKIFFIVMSLINCGLFGYIISAMSSIMPEI